MRRKDKLPELLAPAGDFECLIAAVRGGADAIYIGGKSFSARAYAKNFDIDEIKRAVSYCHLHGVKLYVTMNVLIYDNEIDEALRFAHDLYAVGVDALIAADLGFVSRMREVLPEFEIHASTQMSVHNSIGADKAYELGCTRVVLARELSGENIKRVTENCLAETEVFLHGALCVCHSGQCLFSSMIGGRSGNRGECAQPCRLPYNDGRYILSLSDLSLARHIKELIDSGVASLKIEGRMKSPDYVYTVTSIYRRLLDENRNSSRSEDVMLERAFSRSGFTDGYFVSDTFKRMTGIRTEENKQASKNEEKGNYDVDRVAVKAEVSIKLGEPSTMKLFFKDNEAFGARCVSVVGDCADVARSQPLTHDGVKERLAKMGNTFLSLSVDDINLTLDEGVNLSPSAINALRRLAAEHFENFDREVRTFNAESSKIAHGIGQIAVSKPFESAIFFNPDVLDKLSVCVEEKHFDVIFVPLTVYNKFKNVANGVYIPPVIMENEISEIRELLTAAKEQGASYALIGNLAHISLAKDAELTPVGDFRLNACNTFALNCIKSMGIDDVITSPELTAPQSCKMGGGVVVYGRIPLMVTERCFMKENFGCQKCGKIALIDRKGVKFPMMREYSHRNLIFNSAYTYMGDKMSDIASRNITGHHYIFTTETPAEISSVLYAFENSERFPLNGSFRRVGKRKID